MPAATAQTSNSSDTNRPSHIAFTVRPGKDNDKSFWTPCGVAWAHKDGKGFRIKLDAVPVNGVIELRVNDPKAANDKGSGIDWDFSSYGEGL